MNLKRRTLFLSALLLAAAGCQSTVNTVENTDKHMTAEFVRDSRVVTDPFLRDRLAVKSLTVSQTSGGFTRVQLEAVNTRTNAFSQFWSWLTGENPYRIRYKFTWFAADGMTVESVLSDWQDATVVPGETLSLSSVAPRADCRDFRISLREAD